MSNKELLDNIAAEVVVCIKCDLCKGRKKAVPGVGNPETSILFVGEAPGQSEDKRGEPFVGAAGKFLDNLLFDIGFSRADVFITNIVKCRPPRNRDPRPDEIDTCAPYLNRQIAVIQPKFIVTLGNHSTAYVLSKAMLPFHGITQTRGKIFDVKIFGMEMAVFPMFHPAAALYSGQYRKQLIKDFQQMKNVLLERDFVSPSSS